MSATIPSSALRPPRTAPRRGGSSGRSASPDRNIIVPSTDAARHAAIEANWNRLRALPDSRRADALRRTIDAVQSRLPATARGALSQIWLLLCNEGRVGRVPTQREIAVAAGLSDEAVRYAAVRLLSAGLVSVRRLGHASPVLLVIDDALVKEACDGV